VKEHCISMAQKGVGDAVAHRSGAHHADRSN